ncbi:hypothetical protein JCM10908_000066 [Rhodotorula pacifica]|uniref:uncharacterized protein n=1 Tax=Rhodotorula pacifica TaxID=1495444 RepID=UPI00317A0B71
MPFHFGSSSRSSTLSNASPSSSPAIPSREDAAETTARTNRALKPILTHGGGGATGTGNNMPERSVTLVASPTISSMHSASSESSSLHQAVSRGHSHEHDHDRDSKRSHGHGHGHPHSRSHSHERHGKHSANSGKHSSSSSKHTPDRIDLPQQFKDPIHLAETAITALFTIPGPPIEHLQKDVLPRLYHAAYEHRVNCREHGMKEMVQLIARFRERFSSVKIKFRSHLMDMDGTATLHAAAVGLVYDIHARLAHTPSSSAAHTNAHAHELEPIRAPVLSVVKIFEGKIAQVDMVVDTKDMQPGSTASQPELSCTIM